MSDGYTYTTLSSRLGEPVQVSVSFHLDQDAWIEVPGTATGKPHLSVAHGDVSVSIGPASPDQVTEQDARLARKLAERAATYAAAVERPAAAASPGTAAA
jgi:hypothetical protein